MSRYFTLSADIHIPTPMAKNVVKKTSNGSNNKFIVGRTQNQIIIPTINPKAIAKSISPAPTAAQGIIMRGKYTLVMRFALPTKLLPLFVMALEKKVQGINPARANSGYETPSEGIPAKRPKNSQKISIVKSG